MADDKKTNNVDERILKIKKKHTEHHKTYLTRIVSTTNIIIFIILMIFIVGEIKSCKENVEKKELARHTLYSNPFEKKWDNIVSLKAGEVYVIDQAEKNYPGFDWGKDSPVELTINVYNKKGEYVGTFIEQPYQQNLNLGSSDISFIEIYSKKSSFKLGYSFK